MPTASPDDATLARRMHGITEPVHTILYFCEEAREEFAALGLEPFAQGYVAGRAAPMGRVDAATTHAVFYNFSPAIIGLGVPAAWDIASPADVLAARGRAMEAVFTRLAVPEDGIAAATAAFVEAATACRFEGRPLAAGNAAVALPGTLWGDFWQSLAVLREHRGDGHVALLVGAELTGVEALVLYSAWQRRVSKRFLMMSRMYDEAAWEGGIASLRDRGLWSGTGEEQGPSDAGLALRDELEAATDRLAAAPWAHLGEDRCRALHATLTTTLEAMNAAEAYPRPAPVPTWD